MKKIITLLFILSSFMVKAQQDTIINSFYAEHDGFDQSRFVIGYKLNTDSNNAIYPHNSFLLYRTRMELMSDSLILNGTIITGPRFQATQNAVKKIQSYDSLDFVHFKFAYDHVNDYNLQAYLKTGDSLQYITPHSLSSLNLVTNSSSGTFTNKAGSISMWSNDMLYTTLNDTSGLLGTKHWVLSRNYLDAELDPLWNEEKINYYNRAQTDLRYLQSFTETDPLFNSKFASKSSDALSEGSTNLYYNTARWDARLAQKTTDNISEGITNKYFSNTLVREAIILANGGNNGVATYSNVTGVLNIPNYGLPLYSNNGTVLGGAGQVIFYLTSDKTINGTALYSSVNAVLPLINDADNNYTYAWTVSLDKKTLIITCKKSPQIFVPLVGLTLIGIPVNIVNGTNVQVFVNGN